MKFAAKDREYGDPPKKLFFFGLFRIFLGKEQKDRWYQWGYESQAAAAAAEKFTEKRIEVERKKNMEDAEKH